ncbi:MAG: PAS domain S-box protein [Euryarchaeota archaeon]|nr:PAS domain S-box protein [Euryarchaeota archaeon]
MSVAKILIVEDEGLTAMELQRKLKNWGYEVPTFAFSGKDAINKVKEVKPDIVLMDIVLKGRIDGIEAAKEIIDDYNIPVIYVTAYGDEETFQRAKMTDPAGYMLKPFDENELRKKIEVALKKHQKEINLKETGEWLDKKLKDSGGAVIITDVDGCIRFVNSSVKSLTGWESDDSLFKSLIDVFNVQSEEIRKIIKNPVEEILRDGTASELNGESVLISREGKKIDIEYTIAPIRDDKGEFVGANLIFQDITERKKEEEALFESEKRFKSIYLQSPVAIGIFKPDGQLMDINKAVLELFGASDIQDLMELNLFQDFKLSDAEKKRLFDGQTVKYESEFDFEKIKELSLYKTIKSDIIYLEVFINPLSVEEDGYLSGYLVQFFDITLHKMLEKSILESKSNYEELVASITDVFFEMDRSLKFVYWNKASENLTSIPSKDAIGKSLYDIFPDVKGTEIEEMYMNVLNVQEPQYIVKEYKNQDDQIFFEFNVYPSLRGVSVFIKDITGVKIVEKELKKSEKLYRSVVEDQTEFICRFTPEGVLTFANDAYFNYFGKGVIGKSFMFFSPEKDQESVKKHIESFNPQNPVNTFENQVKMTNGDIKWFEWVNKAIFDDQSQVIEFQSVGRDITERKQIEESLREKKDELKKLAKREVEAFSNEKKALKAEITAITQKRDELQKTYDESVEQAEKRIDELIKDKETLKAEITQIKQKEEILRRDHEELDIQVQKQANDRIKDKEMFNAEINKVEMEKNDLRKKYQELDIQTHKQVESSKKEREALKAEILQLRQTEKEMNESIRDKENLLKEIHRRVKTNMQAISSLVGLQSGYIMDQFIEKFEESQNHIKSIALVHEKLYESKDLKRINFLEYLQNLTDDLLRTRGVDQDNIKLKIDIKDIFLDIDRAMNCGLIINELVNNSIKHAFLDNKGEIMIKIDSRDDDFTLIVSDNGAGLPENLDFRNAQTLGLRLVNTLVRQLDGTIELDKSKGTEFKIKFAKKSQ